MHLARRRRVGLREGLADDVAATKEGSALSIREVVPVLLCLVVKISRDLVGIPGLDQTGQTLIPADLDPSAGLAGPAEGAERVLDEIPEFLSRNRGYIAALCGQGRTRRTCRPF